MVTSTLVEYGFMMATAGDVGGMTSLAWAFFMLCFVLFSTTGYILGFFASLIIHFYLCVSQIANRVDSGLFYYYCICMHDFWPIIFAPDVAVFGVRWWGGKRKRNGGASGENGAHGWRRKRWTESGSMDDGVSIWFFCLCFFFVLPDNQYT